jgi:hypothetical protein
MPKISRLIIIFATLRADRCYIILLSFRNVAALNRTKYSLKMFYFVDNKKLCLKNELLLYP